MSSDAGTTTSSTGQKTAPITTANPNRTRL